MYLKKLQLQGFKTFAQKTDFIFDGSITAIVGPNGSGKSNVADGLRWALGEQSYLALRGKRTEDIIFSGSSKRQPVGMAEVSLTIDNSSGALPIEFNEVVITRRAYRDGNNEYYVNRSRVRLRDVAELTANLNHAYTIINQGLVDVALSQRPEERRALFEAAAGIAHFYSQKEQTELRLHQTEDNAVRLNDIATELEPRLRQLERQAKLARDARRITDELNARLLAWYSVCYAAARAAVAEAEAAVNRLQSGVDIATATVEAARQDEATARAAVQAARQELERSTGERNAAARRREELERITAAAAANLAALLRQSEEQSAAIADDEWLIQQRGKAVVTAKAELAATEQRLASLRAELTATESESRAADAAFVALEQQLNAASRAHTNASAAFAAAERAAADANHALARAHQQVVTATNALPPLEQRVAEAERTLLAAQSASDKASAALDKARARLTAREQDLAATIEQQRAADAALVPLHASEQRLIARSEALERLTESGAGLYSGVHAALDASSGKRKILSGIVGTVASLIHTPTELETAIEIALGGHLQDIVVDSFAAAEAAIAYLKAAKAGRATFLPLDTIRPARKLNPPAAKGVVGVAADLVSYEPKLSAVAAMLLGRHLVVDSLPTARALLDKRDEAWTFVTVEGELVRPGGAVTGGGGQGKADSGLFARERERRELPAQLAAIRAEVAAATATQSRAATAINAATAARNDAQAALNAAIATQSKAQANVTTASAALERERRELEYARAAVQQAQAAAAAAEATIPTRAAEVERSRVAMQQAAADLEATSQTVQRERDARAAQLAALAQLRANLHAGEDELRRHRAALIAANAECDAATRTLAARRIRLAQLQAATDAAESERTGAVANLAELNTRLADLEASLQPLHDALTAAEQAADVAAAAIAARQSGFFEVQQQQSRARLALERAHLEAGDVLLRARAELGEDVALDDHPSANLDESRIQDEISALRTRLARIGVVNPLALAEYDEVNARHSFLTTQLADLRAAAASLREVSAELERTMRERFATTFSAVALEFSRFFTRLFGGGNARLELSASRNSDGPEGVEIFAQPPGKRWQPLASLSGGERALTAVALLFAILAVNPSPFCLLDEVDAALDESNIGRFTAALQELARHTQFIIITHNRATIAAAQSVYGISLGDDHTSRAISVHLGELVVSSAGRTAVRPYGRKTVFRIGFQ
ncbi:MAG: chromosome segregation protein SMC [Candidatus Chloroheliales bacterium]|nr:MAG: chromosome segregation protein SMC [Chloroflexota bacterium]